VSAKVWFGNDTRDATFFHRAPDPLGPYDEVELEGLPVEPEGILETGLPRQPHLLLLRATSIALGDAHGDGQGWEIIDTSSEFALQQGFVRSIEDRIEAVVMNDRSNTWIIDLVSRTARAQPIHLPAGPFECETRPLECGWTNVARQAQTLLPIDDGRALLTNAVGCRRLYIGDFPGQCKQTLGLPIGPFPEMGMNDFGPAHADGRKITFSAGGRQILELDWSPVDRAE
jgi:hypothetical protein